MKKQVALYFGSFNPVHIGHLIIGEFVAGMENIEEVWFVVSPNNPLKNASDLAPVSDRLKMVHLALKNNPKLVCCDIELSMPVPSYTFDTLSLITKTFPKKTFSVLMGEDQLSGLHQWKNWKEILDKYSLLVFPRHDVSGPISREMQGSSYDIIRIAAPRIEVSATSIRERVRNGLSVRYLVPDEVARYMKEKKLYRQNL